MSIKGNFFLFDIWIEFLLINIKYEVSNKREGFIKMLGEIKGSVDSKNWREMFFNYWEGGVGGGRNFCF